MGRTLIEIPESNLNLTKTDETVEECCVVSVVNDEYAIADCTEQLDQSSSKEDDVVDVDPVSAEVRSDGPEAPDVNEKQPKSGDSSTPHLYATKTVGEKIQVLSVIENNPRRTGTCSTETATRHGILSLPIDSLHCIASFLKPREWCNGFGLMNKGSAVLCREIVRRVRLHGFRCATEVVTAYKTGQVADAQELAALYVSAGVPLYARCLGHTYHTLYWRIQVEHRQQLQQQQQQQQHSEESKQSDNEAGSSQDTVDPLYTGRLDFRNRNRYTRELTYLEEKCLFYHERNEASTETDTPNTRRRLVDTLPRLDIRSNNNLNVGNSLEYNNPKPDPLEPWKVPPKIKIPIHQHLLDRHEIGDLAVNDYEGKMTSPAISLSAEFFHPSSKVRRRNNRTQHSAQRSARDTGDMSIASGDALEYYPNHELRRSFENRVPPLDLDLAEQTDGVPLGRPGVLDLLDNGIGIMEIITPRSMHADGNDDDLFQTPQQSMVPVERLRSAMQSTELETYSSTRSQGALSLNNKNLLENTSNSHDITRHLRSRFATYQRRLESISSQNGGRVSGQFEECLLDFWDEFFPHTADIHYHDTETAVPRLSRLQKFLTKPCPQAIGVVQCEIERIRIGSRGKGVNMKGRFFPTYEYRLFIRNRPVLTPIEHFADNPKEESADEPLRRDSVLMVAKNRGRRHAETSGIAQSKKGSNNYYLYMPKQMDVDEHFNLVNNITTKDKSNGARLQPNGVGSDPVLTSDEAGSVLLGRLQSNFIGTEFQIFTPCTRKVSQPTQMHQSGHASHRHLQFSEDELDYDSGVSSDTNSNPGSCRKSRFGRLSRRRNGSSATNLFASDFPPISVISDVSPPHSVDHPRSVSRILLSRTFSSPDLSNQGRLTRTNRRAIANSNDAKERNTSASKYLCEEENGVITYTANLLGSRPRIMDVCVPRINADGSPGLEWKKYLSSTQDHNQENFENSRMLSCFRLLQQRRDGQEANNATPNGNAAQNAAHDHPNTLNRQNDTDNNASSPDDYGLLLLQNRPPWWNVELGSFVLNFGGRVSVASVKNFQLCERTDQEKVMLQFGRIQGRHSFTMDFQHPLTAVQAFSIAISSLQSKISFG